MFSHSGKVWNLSSDRGKKVSKPLSHCLEFHCSAGLSKEVNQPLWAAKSAGMEMGLGKGCPASVTILVPPSGPALSQRKHLNLFCQSPW